MSEFIPYWNNNYKNLSEKLYLNNNQNILYSEKLNNTLTKNTFNTNNLTFKNDKKFLLNLNILKVIK